MRPLRTVGAMARADFLERARTYGFLATLGAVAYLGYTVHAGWWSVHIGGYFGETGPAWTGTLVAVVTTVLLSLFGFYVVTGSVERDLRTRVGPILASTPVTQLQYAAAKFTSNLAVLLAMLLLLMLLAVAMSLTRSGGLPVTGAWQVISPFLLLVAPMLAAVAGIAVLFDCLPWLRGTAGNVLYFFLWTGFLTLSGFDAASGWLDLTGISLMTDSMGEAMLAAHPDATVTGLSVQIRAAGASVETVATFPWSGVPWSLEHAGLRGGWVAVGGALTGLGALGLRLFDPFSDSQPGDVSDAAVDARGDRVSSGRFAPSGRSPSARAAAATGGHTAPDGAFGASALSPPRTASPLLAFLRTTGGELRMLLTGHAWWWYGGLAVANVVALFVPRGSVTMVLLAAWLLPVAAWSSLGCRERLHGTEPLLFSSPGPRLRQLPAQWAAGVALAILAAAGPILRLASAGASGDLLAMGAGALFIPSLALCLGAWSGTTKAFEILYLLLWYLGPVNEVPPLDYMGVTGRAVEAGATQAFLAAAGGLVLMAWIGRDWRLRATG